MYHVSAQGVDECMINVHYYYYDVERILCTDEETLWTDVEITLCADVENFMDQRG